MSLEGRHAFETALGLCVIGWRGEGLVALSLGVEVRESRNTAGNSSIPAFTARAIDDVRRYLDGERVDLVRYPLALGDASAFHRRVWEALCGLPFSETVTYGALARRSGAPGAARAVGTAMARNPLPLFIPCHRVLPASGGIGAYSAGRGPRTKAWLLALEGVRLASDEGLNTASLRASPR